MKIIENGNIFEDPADAIVIPVNCVGTLGKGLALTAKHRWPEMEQRYTAGCRNGFIKPGTLWGWRLDVMDDDRLVQVWLGATKNHWRNPSQIEWIEAICTRIKETSIARNRQSFAVPALGCGLGELRWADVLPIMEHHFADLNVSVYAPLEGGR